MRIPLKCPKDGAELRHSSPSKQLGIKNRYASLVYVCDACHGVWVENPEIALLKVEQAEVSRKPKTAELVVCPSCHEKVGGLVEAGLDYSGLMVCPHCAAILRYENMHVGKRIG